MPTRAKFLLLLLLLPFASMRAQWQPIGPYGGNVNDLIAVDSTFWAATGSGVFRSVDGALTWELRPAPVPPAFVATHIVASPTRLLVRFSGTLPPDRLLETTDGGDSWTDLPLPPGGLLIKRLFGIETVFYAINSTGLWRLADGSTTWEAETVPVTFSDGIKLEHAGSALYLFSPSDGVWRRPDGSTNWEPVSTPAGVIEFFHAHDDSLWFAATLTTEVLYRSTNQGQSWQATFWNAPFSSNISQILWADGVFYGLRSFQVVRSSDSLIWELAGPFTMPVQYHQELAAANGILVSRAGGFLRSGDAGFSFQPANNGFIGTTIQAMEAHNGLVFIGDFSNGDPATNVWEPGYTAPIVPQIRSMIRHGNYSYATASTGTKSHLVLRSDSDWADWQTMASHTGLGFGRLLASGPNLYTVLSSAGGGLAFRLDDEGETPVDISETFQDQTFQYAVTMAPIGNRVVAAVSNELSTLFRSEDRGDTWAPLATTGLYGDGFIPTINELLNAGDILFARVGLLLFRSADQGANWTLATDGLPAGPGLFNDVLAVGSAILLATSQAGVYRSLDGGQSWEPFSEGLGEVNAQVLRADGNLVYIGTANYGVWKRGLSEVTGVFTPHQARQTLRLMPNPAGDWFRIEPEQEQAFLGRLRLVDFNGRVRLQRMVAAGEVVALPDGLEPGVYWVTWVAGEQPHIGRIVVAR